MLLSQFFGRQSVRSTRRPRHVRQLLIEGLEGRRLLSASTVSDVVGAHVGAPAIVGNHFGTNAIQGNHIGTPDIVGNHIGTNAIQGNHIGTPDIVGNHIGTKMIQGNHIGTNAVGDAVKKV
jgi:hypothetical protein